MKSQIKYVTLSVLLFISSNVIKAQTTTEEFTNEFFYLYENSPEEAFTFLTITPFKNTDVHTIKNLKMQFLNNLARVGSYTGYEMISEKSVGTSLKHLSYLIKHEKRPYRFSAIFYKPKDKWLVIDFHFDEKPITELKESWNNTSND